MGRSLWKGDGARKDPAKPKELLRGVDEADDSGEGLSKVEGRLPSVSNDERYMVVCTVKLEVSFGSYGIVE